MLAAPGALGRLVHRRRGDHGLVCASSRQRSRVPAFTSTPRDTTSSGALSGGSKRATALSLNACPYRAKSVLHRRPRGWFVEATPILTREEPKAAVAWAHGQTETGQKLAEQALQAQAASGLEPGALAFQREALQRLLS